MPVSSGASMWKRWVYQSQRDLLPEEKHPNGAESGKTKGAVQGDGKQKTNTKEYRM